MYIHQLIKIIYYYVLQPTHCNDFSTSCYIDSAVDVLHFGIQTLRYTTVSFLYDMCTFQNLLTCPWYILLQKTFCIVVLSMNRPDLNDKIIISQFYVRL